MMVRKHPGWTDRRHFFRAAAMAMRCILVNHARDRRRQKRGGDARRLPLDETLAVFEQRAVNVLSLNDAPERFRSLDERQVEIVELRFFAGLSLEETASVLSVSIRTVQADWSLARAWLFQEMNAA